MILTTLNIKQKQTGLQDHFGAYGDVMRSLLMLLIIYDSLAELQTAKLCTSFNIYGTPKSLRFLPFKSQVRQVSQQTSPS